MPSQTKDPVTTSYLSDAQKVGKGKMELQDIDTAISSITNIINQEQAQLYRDQNKEDSWPSAKIVFYCRDCDDIGSGSAIQGKRNTIKNVCGNCGGKKISMGKEDSLRKFYHITEKELQEKNDKKKEKNNR